ncbi:Arc family DNA-binding protein [Martelella sp. FOR1707]
MTSENRTNIDGYQLRLPVGARDEIKAAAAENGRSMNAEILARISANAAFSMRDRFAMAAITGYIASMADPDSGGPHNRYNEEVAQYGYDIADAMLKVRGHAP